MHVFSIRSALANAFKIPIRSAPSAQNGSVTGLRDATNVPSMRTLAPFSTSTARSAKKKGAVKPDKRITLIRYFLHHPTTLTPRPLRFSRNRYLRHWTIHRAWNLYRSKVRQARQLELERQYNAMRDANEELRIGAGDGGKLFRKAQMKTAVFSIPERGGGVPIEYAKGLTEWVGTKGMLGGDAKVWDSTWKRQ